MKRSHHQCHVHHVQVLLEDGNYEGLEINELELAGCLLVVNWKFGYWI